VDKSATGSVNFLFGLFRSPRPREQRSFVFEYASAPLATSTTEFAQIGEESNGSFF
jgi:hypothetical protein